jgi:hypothetical protein
VPVAGYGQAHGPHRASPTLRDTGAGRVFWPKFQLSLKKILTLTFDCRSKATIPPGLPRRKLSE